MTTPTAKLTRLADDILRSLDALEEATGQEPDPHVAAVRGHVLALAQLLGANPTLAEDLAHGRQITPKETPISKEPERRIRGFQPTSKPPAAAPHLEGKRPGLYTERRAARQQAGVSLQQIRESTGMSLATVRMYEVRPQSVRPDKRMQLDSIYAQFTNPRTK